MSTRRERNINEDLFETALLRERTNLIQCFFGGSFSVQAEQEAEAVR